MDFCFLKVAYSIKTGSIACYWIFQALSMETLMGRIYQDE